MIAYTTLLLLSLMLLFACSPKEVEEEVNDLDTMVMDGEDLDDSSAIAGAPDITQEEILWNEEPDGEIFEDE